MGRPKLYHIDSFREHLNHLVGLQSTYFACPRSAVGKVRFMRVLIEHFNSERTSYAAPVITQFYLVGFRQPGIRSVISFQRPPDVAEVEHATSGRRHTYIHIPSGQRCVSLLPSIDPSKCPHDREHTVWV